MKRFLKVAIVSIPSLLTFGILGCSGGSESGKNLNPEPTPSPISTPPVAAIDAPERASIGATLLFDASRSYDPDGDAITYKIESPEEFVESDTPYLPLTFHSTGITPVTLTVTDTNGDSDSLSFDVEVESASCVATFKLTAELSSIDTPQFRSIPFPNDLFIDTETGLLSVEFTDIGNDRADTVISQGGTTQDGFGLSSGIFFPIHADLLTSELPSPQESTELGSPLFVIDLESGKRHPVRSFFDEEKHHLVIMPEYGTPFKEATPYVAVVTTALRGEKEGKGGNIVADSHFETLREGGVLNAPLYPQAQSLYSDAFALLDQQPDLPDRRLIAAATVFTTQRITKDILAIREEMATLSAPVPTLEVFYTDDASIDCENNPLCRGDLTTLLGTPEADKLGNRVDASTAGLDLSGGVAHNFIETIVTRGSFPSPWYLGKTSDASLGGFVYDKDRLPVIQEMREIPFSLAIPKTEPPTENGYPVVLIQHGLGGRRDFIMALANSLAEHGFASVAIDAVAHGGRARLHQDKEYNFGSGCSKDEECPDGWEDFNAVLSAESTMEFFALFLSGPAIRDHFRQTVVDLMQTVRMVRNLNSSEASESLSAIGSHLFDTNHVYYIGDSLGGIIGGIFCSIDPYIQACALNVPGGLLGPGLLTNSPEIGLYNLYLSPLYGIELNNLFDPTNEFIQITQGNIDAGDPINYARHAICEPLADDSPTDILQIEVMWDQLVPNLSNETLAKSFNTEDCSAMKLYDPFYHAIEGMETVTGSYSNPNGTAVLTQWSPNHHGSNISSRIVNIDYQFGFPLEDKKGLQKFSTVDPACPDDPNEEHASYCFIETGIDTLHAQIIHFFKTNLETGTAEFDPLGWEGPNLDLDGDGVNDEDEIAAGLDPMQYRK